MGNILKEICLTTGLKVEEGLSKEFTKVFNKFILAHYGILTPGEIALAFTLNAANDLPEKMEFFGSNLTIEHVGKVLFQYIRKRANLAAKINEERYKQELPPPIPTKDEQEMNDKLFANEYYRKYLYHEFSLVSLEYAHWVYDTLDRFKLIRYTVAEKKRYMEEAELMRQQEIHAPPVDFHKHKEMNRLINAYINNLVPESEKQLVKQYAKRLALMDLFKRWKEQGRNRIFD